MTLAMMFTRSYLEMGKMDPEDRDCAKTEAIGWTLVVLAIIATEIEPADLLH